jgi:hypothetical protein
MSLDVLRRGVLLAAGVVLGLAMLTPAQAAQDEKKAKKGKPQQVVPTGAEDSATPTAAEAEGEANLEQMLDRSTEGLQVIRLDNGVELVDLEGRFMHVSTVLRRGDGSAVKSCVSSKLDLQKAQEAARASRKPAPVVLEEK